MTREFAPARLDVRSFAQAQASLSGRSALAAFPRLADEIVASGDADVVIWSASAELRPGTAGALEPWLHLEAQTSLRLICQRCLAPVALPLAVDRWFRFVASEAVAEAEDEFSEEDVLAVSREFDLNGLIEDELLMDIPITPVHPQCPQPVVLSAQDPAFEVAQKEVTQPFAVLEALRNKKPG